MSRTTDPRIARPTIAEALEAFLADQQARLAPRTFAKYRDVIELLQHSLNGYAYQSLNAADAALFDDFSEREGAEHREYCETFGPERILPEIGSFLGYFMVRKVMAGKETLRAAGTVTKKLARWLEEKGHCATADADLAVEAGAEASSDLPQAEELAQALHELTGWQTSDGDGDVIEDHFTLTRVEKGRIWLQGLSEPEIGPIAVPEAISRRCRVGWSISGALQRSGKSWRILEAWNVYPLIS